jgi:hypothetical protein
MWLQLTSVDGNPCWVNIDLAAQMVRAGDTTRVYFGSSDHFCTVKEDPPRILGMIDKLAAH